MDFEAYLSLVEQDPDHAYEYLNGRVYMMTGDSPEFPLVEVFHREKQGFWSLYTLGISDTIELSSLGLQFPVAEVYLNTSFLEEGNG